MVYISHKFHAYAIISMQSQLAQVPKLYFNITFTKFGKEKGQQTWMIEWFTLVNQLINQAYLLR